MEYSFFQLNDLPDEIVLIILKKLNNVEVLYSLIGINDRLNTIAHDSIFTSHLTFMKNSLDHPNDPLPSPMLDRLCSQILPEIHSKIKWLNLEPSSIKRILLATNYPNLYGLGLYNIGIQTAMSLFIDKSFLINIDKNQISSLIIDITKYEKIISIRDLNKLIVTHIFTEFTNLKYLNFGQPSINYSRLTLDILPPTIISSTLLELHICVGRISDCLYLLDGRFNNLRIFHVNTVHISCSSIIINNTEKLSNLKCFSLHCSMTTYVYDELIVPLLHRMSNLEELDLNLFVSKGETFIDGNDLKKNIINYMPQLNKFTFYICSSVHYDNQIDVPSNENIQHTFSDFKNKHIISYIDYFQEPQYSKCHIYSFPNKLKFYKDITNNFPGGLFKCVHTVSLFDQRPFEHEFFLRISQSFPVVKKICVRNTKPQNNKLCSKSQDLTIIKYPHLTALTLYIAHDDYIEQFLDDRKTCLPNTVYLTVEFEPLKRVTQNFTRNTTRIDCAKLKSLFLNGHELPRYAKDYFPHTNDVI